MRFLYILTAVLFFSSCGTPTPSTKTADPAITPTTQTNPTNSQTLSETLPAEADTAASQPRPSLYPQPIHLQKGIDLTLYIPDGYRIGVAFEGLRRLRFLSKSPDGRLFATDMYNTSDNKKGRVYIFDKWDTAAKQFRSIRTYMDGLHNPNQVAFYTDGGKQYIYISETGVLSRYVYQNGDSIPGGRPDTIATFPDYGLGYKYGGWHLTRSLAFHDHKLYVSVGSSCNACIETEDVRATVLQMDPDGRNKRIFASGLRNSVGLKWVGRQLWVTSMGRDLLGADKPEDLFQKVDQGKFYGWPYYFQYRDSVYADTAMQRLAKLQGTPIPAHPAPGYCGFAAHSAPLGFDHFENFDDAALNNHFLVALHGSTTVSRQRGNCIVLITGRNAYWHVVDGFLSGKTSTNRKGRPCDVLQNDSRSFFFTDDHNGVLYYVWKEK